MGKLFYIIVSILLFNSLQSYCAAEGMNYINECISSCQVAADVDDAADVGIYKSLLDIEDVEENVSFESEIYYSDFPEFVIVFHKSVTCLKRANLILFEADTSPPFIN